MKQFLSAFVLAAVLLFSLGLLAKDWLDTNTAVLNARSTPTAVAVVHCSYHGQLPDPICTPGAADPRVTQDNIQQTICNHKPDYNGKTWSQYVRPPDSVTAPMKLQSMMQYGASLAPSRYEYDHLISLELGGAPEDTHNLWAEPGASPNPKDTVENKLNALVCSGAMLLADAQHRISTDWTTAIP